MASAVTPAQEVEVEDGRVVYHALGDGPPLVLIHGLAGSTRWWSRNIEPLARHFRVIALDLIGFGESRGGAFVLAKAADVVCQVLDRLQIPRAHVIGHSMGGTIAFDLALRRPERIDRLVLVDAAILGPGSTRRGYVFGLMRQSRHLPLRFVPVLLRDVVRAQPRALMEGANGLFSLSLWERVPEVAVPTLLVWGEYDTTVPPAVGRDLLARLPHAQLVVLAGGGHNPMWSCAEEFNHAVLDFLLAPAAGAASVAPATCAPGPSLAPGATEPRV